MKNYYVGIETILLILAIGSGLLLIAMACQLDRLEQQVQTLQQKGHHSTK